MTSAFSIFARRSSACILLGLCLVLALAPASLAAAVQAPAQAPAQEAGVPQEIPIVSNIEVSGARSYSPEQLIAALGQAVGAPLSTRAVSEGLERLWASFGARASVEVRGEADGTVTLLLSVREQPYDLEPRFLGNDKINTDQLLEWALLDRKREVRVTELPRIEQRILEGYREKGFLFADVRATWADPTRSDEAALDPEEADAADVIFVVFEGPVVRVKEVTLRGNESFPNEGFLFWKDGLAPLARVKQKSPGVFNWFGSRYSRGEFEADLIAMRNVYRDRGYLDAVVELVREEFSKDRSDVRLHVAIDEGTRYLVESLEIEGVEIVADGTLPEGRRELPAELVFDEERLKDLLVLEPGKPYELSRRREDERKLRDFYGARGYISHPSLGQFDGWRFLEPELVFDLEAKTVRVTYRISQGRRWTIREVLITGTSHTRDRVVRSDITQLPGEIADLSKLARSRSRIAGTGFFSDPSDPIGHREPDYRLKPVPDQPGMLDVEYIVDEGRVVDFQIAGGIDSNSGAFGLISLSMRNFDIADWPNSFFGMFGEIYRKEAFHGAGQQLDIQVSPGSEINFWRVRFQEPDLFRSHFKQISLDIEAGQRERLFRPYDEERTTGKIRLGYEPFPDLRIYGGYQDSRVEVDDLDDPPFPQQLFDQQGEADLNALSLDFSYRQLDSTINPREGVTVNFNNAWYADAFGSDFEYLKSSIAGDLYWPVGDPLADVRPSFHFSGGLGVASPQGDSDFVPYTERFFLGGFRTLRGFGFRGVGPNVGRTPIGGETYFNASLEYRIPIYTIAQPGTYKQVEMFRLIPFVDIGNLGQEDFQLDETETRVSAGIGFGLANPFPLTINFGFPLREGDGDDRQVFSFNLAFR